MDSDRYTWCMKLEQVPGFLYAFWCHSHVCMFKIMLWTWNASPGHVLAPRLTVCFTFMCLILLFIYCMASLPFSIVLLGQFIGALCHSFSYLDHWTFI